MLYNKKLIFIFNKKKNNFYLCQEYTFLEVTKDSLKIASSKELLFKINK